MEVDGQLLEAGADAAELFEPADALLDHAPAAVGPAVEPDRRVVAGLLVVLVRDDRRDLLVQEPVADALDAVGLVGGELAGLVAALAFVAAASDQGRDGVADDLVTEDSADLLCQVSRHQAAGADAAGRRAQQHLAVGAEARPRGGDDLEALGAGDEGLTHISCGAGGRGHPRLRARGRSGRRRRREGGWGRIFGENRA